MSQLVCVTGASGYLAGNIIKQLMKKGTYKIRGTVRSLQNPEKVQHLQDLFPEVELFEADLCIDGSFDDAFENCDGVFHCASPFQMNVEDPQRDLVDPAVNGTKNVLNSVIKQKVKKVVLTSSCAAIASQAIPEDGKIWSEDDWNNDSTLSEGPYRLSKSLAEKAAWKITEQNDFDLISINPAFILGPPLSKRKDSTSIARICELLEGQYKNQVPKSCFGVVDVLDVANGHVLAYEKEEAIGKRFILSSSKGFGIYDMSEEIRKLDFVDEYIDNLPTSPPDIHHVPLYNNNRAKNVLGLDFTPISETLSNMVKFLIENDLIQPANNNN